jgi:large subunit ribosomal protein L23
MILEGILLEPIITEKSTRVVGEDNKYTFKIGRSASKRQVKGAVERLYGVKVLGVNIVNVSGKTRRTLKTRKEFKGKGWKKAVVRLAEGQKIDVFEFPAEEKEKK